MMKPVMRLNALALVILTLLGLLSMSQAQARGFGPTPAEIAVLPPFCKAKLSPDPTDDQQFMATFGGGWGDIHHYCYALNFTNRYYQDYADKPTQRDDLNQAMGNFSYMFSHAPPDFWMFPEIHTQKGRLLAVAKRGSEAAAEFLMAIQENKNYAPAYVALSDFYRNLGQKPKALSTVEDGLKYAPDDRVLVSRYRELTGHAFVPPAVSATPSEGKTTGVKTDANTPIQPGVSIPTPASEGTVAPVATQPAPAAEDSPKIGSPTNPYCRFCP